MTGAEDGHDDGQSHDDLSGSNKHDEQGDHLTVQGTAHAGEGHESRGGRGEHQLGAHEDHDRVAPNQHRRGADREQNRRQVDVVDQAHRSVPSWISRAIARSAPAKSSGSVTCSRAVSTRDTDTSLGVPSGNKAGVSTALRRAETPGAGSPARFLPSRKRRSDHWRWVGRGVRRSRWARTMAPRAAVMSSALVTSKVQTYLPKIRSAIPVMLPPALACVRPTGPAKVTDPSAATSPAPRPAASSRPATFWPLMVSTRESDESTPISISTKRNSIMTAPV